MTEPKDRNTLIKEMLEMQKQFIAREHQGGIDQEQLYAESEDSLSDYQSRYTTLANQLVEAAHNDKGSNR